jgi:Tol biopolymer transport system component
VIRSSSALLLLALVACLTLAAFDAGRAHASRTERIGFSHIDGGSTHIFTMNPDGSDLQQLTFGQGVDGSPAWSPDGTRVAFVSGKGSGKGGDYGIYVMDAAGSNATRLTTTVGGYDLGPSWSPDGSEITFFSNRSGVYDVYKMNADGTHETQVTTNAQVMWPPKWSPDGAHILFASSQVYALGIYVIDANGSNQTRLTNVESYAPDWSPDGSKIAFGKSSVREQIFVMNSDGSDVRALTDGSADDSDPSWSADGQSIAFDSDRNEPASGSEIFRMSADGSDQVQLTTTVGSSNTSDVGPHWEMAAPTPSPESLPHEGGEPAPSRRHAAATAEIALGSLLLFGGSLVFASRLRGRARN